MKQVTTVGSRVTLSLCDETTDLDTSGRVGMLSEPIDLQRSRARNTKEVSVSAGAVKQAATAEAQRLSVEVQALRAAQQTASRRATAHRKTAAALKSSTGRQLQQLEAAVAATEAERRRAEALHAERDALRQATRGATLTLVGFGKPPPRKGPNAAARLDHEVSAGWASPSSHGLCGDALLLSTLRWKPEQEPLSCDLTHDRCSCHPSSAHTR